MKKLLFLLLLLPFASALSCTETGLDVLLGDQAVNISIVLMLTVIVTALSYMAGRLTGNPSLLVFAKDELFHLGFSIVILLGFSGLLLLSCDVMDFFFVNTFSEMDGSLSCYSEHSTIDAVSECYLNSASSDARRMSEFYISEYVDNIMWSTLSMSIAIPLFDTYTAVISSYKRVVSNQFDMVLNTFLIPSMVSLSLQQLLLGFINNNIIAWVVPTAFLLRVFIPTRQMGNMLLALAIGVYILVPYMYTFNLAMLDVALTEDDCHREVSATFNGNDMHYYDAVCDSVMDGYVCWDYDDFSSNRESACDNRYGFWRVASFVPQAFLLPNLTMALLVTFISSVARALRVLG